MFRSFHSKASLKAVICIVLLASSILAGGSVAGTDRPDANLDVQTETTSTSDNAEAVATNAGATVNYRNIRGGRTVSVQLPNVASERTAVTGVDLTPTFTTGDFRVEFTKPQATPPSGTPELDSAHGSSVSYFTAAALGITDDEITEVNFTFTLSESELGDRSTDNVRLFRYVDGEWTTLNTTHLGGDQYRAESPGFTVYAIGVRSSEQETETAVEHTTTKSEGEGWFVTVTETPQRKTPTTAGGSSFSTDTNEPGPRNNGFEPVIPGLIGLGGLVAAGFVLSRYRGQRGTVDEGSDGTIESSLERATSAVEKAENEDDLEAAIENYAEAIDAYETGLAACSPEEDQYQELEYAVAGARQRIAMLSDRKDAISTLVEQIEEAETHFQAAIAGPTSDRVIITRERYRQARDAYDRALELYDELDDLPENLTVSPDVDVSSPPENLSRYPGVTPAAMELLEELDIDTLSALRNADEETIEDLRSADEIQDTLTTRLVGLHHWLGDENFTLASRGELETRKKLAANGYRVHQ